MPDLVTLICMGEEIPEWLMVQEPEVPGAERGRFRFTEDVQVIDTPDFYVVLPNLAEPRRGSLIDNTGTKGCRLLAASKLVYIPQTGYVLYGAEAIPAFREIERQAREAAERAELAAAIRQPSGVVVPDPHPTFWSRLLYAFRGR